jgi:hypothetical protein
MNKLITSILLAVTTTVAHAQAAAPVSLPSTDRCNLFAQTLTGKTYDDTVAARVKAQKFTARVVASDNARYAATMDYRPDRVNLQVEHDKITQASCG